LPVFFPPQGRLGHAPVHAQPLPVDALKAVVFEQPRLPERQEDAGRGPLLEAVVGCGAGAELGGVEGLPLTAGAEDEEDGIHADAIGGAWPSTAEAMGVDVGGDVHLDLSPEVVGNAPIVGDRLCVHECAGKEAAATRKQAQLHREVIALQRLFG